MMWLNRRNGQSLIEYAVLVSAVILGVSVAARVFHGLFVDHASRVERENMVF